MCWQAQVVVRALFAHAGRMKGGFVLVVVAHKERAAGEDFFVGGRCSRRQREEEISSEFWGVGA